jgi:hypothetical protein
MRTLAAALTLAALLPMTGTGLADTGVSQPGADYTKMPIEQAGTSHGTPRADGPSPQGNGDFVVHQGSGVSDQPAASVPGTSCDSGRGGCVEADPKK